MTAERCCYFLSVFELIFRILCKQLGWHCGSWIGLHSLVVNASDFELGLWVQLIQNKSNLSISPHGKLEWIL